MALTSGAVMLLAGAAPGASVGSAMAAPTNGRRDMTRMMILDE